MRVFFNVSSFVPIFDAHSLHSLQRVVNSLTIEKKINNFLFFIIFIIFIYVYGIDITRDELNFRYLALMRFNKATSVAYNSYEYARPQAAVTSVTTTTYIRRVSSSKRHFRRDGRSHSLILPLLLFYVPFSRFSSLLFLLIIVSGRFVLGLHFHLNHSFVHLNIRIIVS